MERTTPGDETVTTVEAPASSAAGSLATSSTAGLLALTAFTCGRPNRPKVKRLDENLSNGLKKRTCARYPDRLELLLS